MEMEDPEIIDPFGGKDILDVLRIYSVIFDNRPIFLLAAREIERLREELAKSGVK